MNLAKGFRRKINFLWHKKYFDTGFSLLNYLKYIIAFFGLASNDVYSTMLLAVFFGVLCYLVGFLWIKFKLADAENEINNLLNPFMKEVRDGLRKKRM